MNDTTIDVDGPFYDDLRIGDRFEGAPVMRLSASTKVRPPGPAATSQP